MFPRLGALVFRHEIVFLDHSVRVLAVHDFLYPVEVRLEKDYCSQFLKHDAARNFSRRTTKLLSHPDKDSPVVRAQFSFLT